MDFRGLRQAVGGFIEGQVKDNFVCLLQEKQKVRLRSAMRKCRRKRG